MAAAWGVKLALLSAHIAPSDLLRWHGNKRMRALLARVLSHFQLIVPQSDVVRLPVSRVATFPISYLC